jgi:hypothetical protein
MAVSGATMARRTLHPRLHVQLQRGVLCGTASCSFNALAEGTACASLPRQAIGACHPTASPSTHFEGVAGPLRQRWRLHGPGRRGHRSEQLQLRVLAWERKRWLARQRRERGAADTHRVESARAQGRHLARGAVIMDKAKLEAEEHGSRTPCGRTSILLGGIAAICYCWQSLAGRRRRPCALLPLRCSTAPRAPCASPPPPRGSWPAPAEPEGRRSWRC